MDDVCHKSIQPCKTRLDQGFEPMSGIDYAPKLLVLVDNVLSRALSLSLYMQDDWRMQLPVFFAWKYSDL